MTLEKYLLPGHIAVNVQADDWEEAIRAVGGLLVDSGSVEPRFVDAMVRVTKELGPYAVIAPGIALPHARPEDGVKRGSLAVLRLAKPVPFGNSVNDPVDVVIALAPVDSSSHIAALAEICDFLRDEENLAALRSAGSCDEVARLLLSGGAPGERR
ncbi:MAG: PTS sugar transporter subunit IIA [Firmicutes bacterium]|nr:PTS sugar transporter subunit IIA [Bacillota bacterium]